MPLPKILIVAFNSANKEIPKAKAFIGPAAKTLSRSEYPMSEVPDWCKMPPTEHQDGVGGCWEISTGEVARKGKDHCETCEYNG